MSRSFKKVAGGPICSIYSEKEWKQQEHRRFRRRIRQLLQAGETEFLPNYKPDYADPWSSPSDGKVVWYWSRQDFYSDKQRERWSYLPAERTRIVYVRYFGK